MDAENNLNDHPQKVRFGDVNDTQPSHDVPKNDNVYHRLGKTKLALAITNSTDRLFNTDANENKCLKAILGVIAGIIFGILLFLFFVFSFGYTYVQASSIALISTIFLCIGLALSSLCRCIVALMFPNMFTQKGRAVLLSIIFGVLINYQVANITHNAQVTGASMSCVVDLATQQAMDIQKQLGVPVKEMAEYINRQVSELKQSTQSIQEVFRKADTAMKQADKALNEAKTFIDNIVKKCDEQLSIVRQACDTACQADIFKIGDVCGKCKQLRCDGLAGLKNGIITLSNDTRGAVDDVLQYFNVEMRITSDMSGSTSTSTNTTAIREQVNDDISAKTDAIHVFLEVLKKVLSVSLVLVLIQAYWYLRNYLAKDGYDNVYITSQFKKLDEVNASHGGEKLLPLKKKEKRDYVDTRSVCLNSYELSHCEIGLVQVALHFLLFLLLTIFDYSLFYILALVQRYAAVDISVQGQGNFEVNIQGKGPVADFYKIMVKNLNQQHTVNATLEIKECLPNPREPDAGILPVLLILYLIAVLMVMLRGYGMRLRRKISAYYYPTQEEARIDFLHKKIRHRRIGFLKFLRHQIKSSHKESAVKEQLRLSTWLSFKFPVLAKCLPKRDTLECTSCEQRESRLHHVVLTKCSGLLGGIPCQAIYCEECWSGLNNVCPLCTATGVALRD